MPQRSAPRGSRNHPLAQPQPHLLPLDLLQRVDELVQIRVVSLLVRVRIRSRVRVAVVESSDVPDNANELFPVTHKVEKRGRNELRKSQRNRRCLGERVGSRTGRAFFFALRRLWLFFMCLIFFLCSSSSSSSPDVASESSLSSVSPVGSQADLEHQHPNKM